MANRYWVGGAGTWNSSSTTNWSATSGGAGGASAPTSADSVIFDTSSGTGTVTITTSSAVCLDMTVTATQALTFSGRPDLYGNLTLPSGGSTVFTNFGPYFRATTTGKTITTSGKTIGAMNFSGTGGGWTLQDTLTSNSIIDFFAGTFNTNGNTINGNRFSIGAGSATVNLGASTISLTGTSAGLLFTGGTPTINAGTSTINISSGTPQFRLNGASITFYDVSITATSDTRFSTTTSSWNWGNVTFRNLSLIGPSSAGLFQIDIYSASSISVTVTGTLTINGGAANRRVCLAKNIYSTVSQSTPLTITAAAVSLSYVDFYNITGAGAASWTGTSIGNAGANSNITFTAPKTVYWNLVGGGNAVTSTAWATTSGGTPAVANFPLPQDTATIVNTGLNTSATVAFPDMLTPAINASARTLAATIALGNTNNTYCAGSVTLSSAITLSPLGVYFTNNSTVTSAGKSFSYISVLNGTLTLADAFSSTSASGVSIYVVSSGGINLNGNTLTAIMFSGNKGTLTFNGGTLLLTGSGASVFIGAAPFTTAAGTGTGKISLNSASAKTFIGGNLTYNCTLEQAGSGALTITGSNTFNDIANSTQPASVLFTAGTTNTFNNFSLSGTSGNLITIGSVTAASHTLSKSSGVVSVNYCTISRSTATGGATWNAYTSNGNVDGGNNSGWNFTAPSSGNGLFFGSNF